MNFILFSFREFHKWDETDVAKKLAITLRRYQDLEFGLNRIDVEIASKLSQLYKAPLQLFLSNDLSNNLSINYLNCHFVNSNGYVNHLYQSDGELKAKEETIQLLKEEVNRLRKENDSLLIKLIDKGTIIS